jgi:cytochrome P450
MRFVTRYAECRDILRDTEAFSNASGFKAPGVVIPPEDRLLGELDPPRHTFVRRVMVTAMTPRVVHAAEPFIDETAAALLNAIPVPGSADLVAGFSVPLPNRVTVRILGLPDDDAAQLAVWAKELMESGFPATNRSHRGEGFAAAFPDFAAYIDAKIEQRVLQAEASERADVLDRLLALEVDGERLPRRQVRALVRNLITGGLTTTSQLLGNLLHALLTVPGLDSAVRADDAALPGAVEESLRLSPPVMFIFRGCRRDVALSGAQLHAGERVVLGTGSANRDEAVFPDGDEFLCERANADQHLTFGYGPHVCPGGNRRR